MGGVTSDPSQPEDNASKKDSGKNKRELVRPALLPLQCPLMVRCVVPGFKAIHLTAAFVNRNRCSYVISINTDLLKGYVMNFVVI